MKKLSRPEYRKFLLERLFVANEIPIYVFDQANKLIDQAGGRADDCIPFVTDSKLVETMRKKYKDIDFPSIEIEEDVFIYGIFTSEAGNCYLCGPFAVEHPTVTKLHQYRTDHFIKDKNFNVPKSTYMKLVNTLSTLYYEVTDLMITEVMILFQNKLVNQKVGGVTDNEFGTYQFEKSEYEMEHLPYQYEQEYLQAIENGDQNFFMRENSAEPNALEKVGKLAENSEKQIEYMCVCSIALATRAAMRGGLNPSIAYSMSELYLQKLEKTHGVKEILKIHNTMRVDFVAKVKESKEKKSSEDYIEKSKDYMSQNIHNPICIKEIADKLGMNHSYLSRKFSEQVGMTMVQYSIRARLRAAANMLKYSQASISEIADYFCFSSQSRFGSQFKNEYGVTPMVYRKENRIIEFHK